MEFLDDVISGDSIAAAYRLIRPHIRRTPGEAYHGSLLARQYGTFHSC
jgi:hypothetical protein